MQTPPSHRLAQTEHHRRTVAHPGAGETNPFPPAPAPQVGTPLLLPQQREAVRQQQQQIAMLTQTQSPRIRLEQSPPSPRSPAEDKPEAARHIENLLLSLPVMPPSTPYGAGPALSPPRSFCTPHASPLPQPAKAKGAARPEADSGDEYEEEMRAHQQQRTPAQGSPRALGPLCSRASAMRTPGAVAVRSSALADQDVAALTQHRTPAAASAARFMGRPKSPGSPPQPRADPTENRYGVPTIKEQLAAAGLKQPPPPSFGLGPSL
eukprot:GAFH01002399.1.p2 GENE.GAFH01002399.1~~GAFH01002399.1.p2  ORF type:complete len:265 (-),score=58.26 GAFH01002399.1:2-796(-)